MRHSIPALIVCASISGCTNSVVDESGSGTTSPVRSAQTTDHETTPVNKDDAASNEPASEGGNQVTNESTEPRYNDLSEFEAYVLLEKGTERAFTGELTDHEAEGTYICRRCNAALYKSDHKFHSGCGWPAFDDEIEGAVTRQPDADGFRVEIICTNCGGHLGHVFEGERLTDKNLRHCVNSVSMKFVDAGNDLPAPIGRTN